MKGIAICPISQDRKLYFVTRHLSGTIKRKLFNQNMSQLPHKEVIIYPGIISINIK